MNNEHRDGGFAFPRASATVTRFNDGGEPETHVGHDGMTLRQWYASQALPAVIAARVSAGTDVNQESIAEECFEIADAMIAADAKHSDDEAGE